jgi:hypothetical protein
MGKYSSAFKKANDAKPINGFAKSPTLGKHRVALKAFRGKESQKTHEVFIESEYVILESETEQIGVTRSTPWFINSGGWPGTYATARLQEFILAVKESISDDRTVEEIGDELADEDKNPGYGIVLDMEVSEVMDKNDASKVQVGKGGRPVHNVAWFAIEQTEEDIAATREKLKAMESAPAQKAPATKPAETTVAPAAANVTKMAGARRLLGGNK